MAQRTDEGPAPGKGRHEILVTILLVVAAVATSWSSYQATRWNGEQALAASRTNAIRIEAARSASLGEGQTQVDVATFIAWADAEGRGEAELADFYIARFRPEFKTAFEAWQATDPLENADAAPTPFAMPDYKVAASVEAERLDREAAASAAEVGRNIQRASNYVLTVVLYAIVLFFAGVSIKLASRRLRMVTITAGYLVLLAALVWVSTFPVSLRV